MSFARCLIVAAIAFVIAACDRSAPPPTANARTCAGLDFTCEELVRLGFTYPFPREPGSFLFVQGVAYPYVDAADDLLGEAVVGLPDGTTITAGRLLAGVGLEAEAEKDSVAVIGYGSNPSPAQLARKFRGNSFAGNAVFPVMKGRLRDYDVVWTPVFVAYGAMPATIIRSPGTEVEVWVTWLDADEIKRMNSSEGTGGLYAFGTLRGVDLDIDGPAAQDPRVYVSCFGALTIDGIIFSVAAIPATGRITKPIDAPTALRRVLPELEWPGTVFELLRANVTDRALRNAHTEKIRDLGAPVADGNFIADLPCAFPPRPTGDDL